MENKKITPYNKVTKHPSLWAGLGGLLLLLLTFSCSENDAADDEYANWQQRNEQFLAAVATDSMSRQGWQRFKKYSLDESTEGVTEDYIYVKVIDSADATETDTPAFTDSVRVSYQGRLIPTATYPEGYVFDGTVYGTYSDKTNSNTKFLVSSMTDGFCTALQHMRRGDHWRVYVPSALGYKEAGSGSTIPGYSVLIFEMTLIDFSPSGQKMPVWSARLSGW